MRARLALAASQTQVQWREIILRDKPESMLAVSPKGTVPVLITESGVVIDESLDIMLWALERNSHPWLRPSQGSLAEMLELIANAESEFKPHLDRYKYANRHEASEALAHRQWAGDFLVPLNARLQTSAWLFGERFSLGDAAIAPFVRQFANTDRAWFDTQSWPALQRWLEVFLALPLFESIMHKRVPWKEGDEEVFFPAGAVALP